MSIICDGCGLKIQNASDECDCDDVCEGRYIPAVCEYASTCDGCCELTHHENLTMDLRTQLGYCEECMQDPKIAAMIEASNKACPDGVPLIPPVLN